ncbi:MAG TPA: hypothetical protein VIZ32_24455 [Vicinamibacterales bacterium]
MQNLRKVAGVVCATTILATTTSFAVAAPDFIPGGSVDPVIELATITPVRPYRSGDYVWKTSPPAPISGGATTMDVGCDRVPANGYIGTNVYADSGAHYANYWYWGSGSSGEPYYWYVKKADGTTQSWGYTASAGSSSVPANVYRWKVQNQGSTPQAWNVCFDVE